MLTIDLVTEETKDQAHRYLQRHEDFCLFLLGNLQAHGIRQTEAPNSGNFYQLSTSKTICGVVSLSRRGNLLVHLDRADDDVCGLIVKTLQSEITQIKGLLGQWEVACRLWEYLKTQQVVSPEVMKDKSILYSLLLDDTALQPIENARLLKADDFHAWRILRLEYMAEMRLRRDLTEAQFEQDFLDKTASQAIWGVFVKDTLVTIGDLNARALDLGQVGGVFTTPTFRQKGLAKMLMYRIIADCHALHRMRKLIIFTALDNHPARRVYESLGVHRGGYYGAFFS